MVCPLIHPAYSSEKSTSSWYSFFKQTSPTSMFSIVTKRLAQQIKASTTLLCCSLLCLILQHPACMHLVKIFFVHSCISMLCDPCEAQIHAEIGILPSVWQIMPLHTIQSHMWSISTMHHLAIFAHKSYMLAWLGENTSNLDNWSINFQIEHNVEIW